MIGVFVLGLFIGAAIGVLIMCLCIITKDIDNELKRLEDVVVKECPVCGIKYRVSYRLRNIKKTCSPTCGHKLRNQEVKEI